MSIDRSRKPEIRRAIQKTQLLLATGTILLGLSLPFLFTSPSHRNLLILIAINVILVASLDLLIGYTGLMSLGHGGFWGIGAYTSALLVMRADIPFLGGLVGAALVAMASGAIIGYPFLKLRGHYFVVVTFITAIILTLLFTSLISVTRGPMGLPGIPFPKVEIPGLFSYTFNPFRSTLSYYYLVLVFVFLALIVKSRIVRSKMGRALTAIKEDEDLAQSIGIHTHRYKLLIFAISAGFAGLAGSLYAHYVTFIGPDSFTFIESFNLFVMNLVGGAGTLMGPVIGPTFLTLVEEFARVFSPVIAEIAFGVLLIVTITFLPSGIVGGIRQLWGRLTDGKG
ncbi:MAG: branched-chain amino acid ABC transporter permease [Candidatus Bipolaricaulia bacterium]